MIVSYKFSFTKEISSQGTVNDLYKSTYVNKIGDIQLSLVSVFVFLWVTVSVVLIIRFICQYTKAMKEISTYRIREDQQCKKYLNEYQMRAKKR